jgi:SAM-dependent methyltransferase
MKDDYTPLIADRYDKEYFSDRYGNNKLRQMQFEIDRAYVKQFSHDGIICDVGCATGEFTKTLTWFQEHYGMEINIDAVNAAKKENIKFDKNIFNQERFFDVVLFRGTIQHVDEPFRMIKAAHRSLKDTGMIIFLATPNSESILYRLKLDLALLDRKLNFYIPGAKSLCNALENISFEVKDVSFPYLRTPYCNLLRDHALFAANIFSTKFIPHAFWGSSMNIAAQKIPH